MKKRLIKKWAKQFLNGTLRVPTREDRWNIDTDGNYVDVTIAVLHPKVERMVHELARQQYGWDGCWWDDPLYLSIRVNGKDLAKLVDTDTGDVIAEVRCSHPLGFDDVVEAVGGRFTSPWVEFEVGGKKYNANDVDLVWDN